MNDIDRLVDDIREREQEKKAEADRIRDKAADTQLTKGTAVEHDMLSDVTPGDLDDVTIGGVDGGLVTKAFHGIDMLLVRAVAAVFSYEDGSLAENAYVPQAAPRPDVEYTTRTLDRTDIDKMASLHRLKKEITLAEQVTDDVDTLLLDGALLPQYADKPASESAIRDQYEDIIDTYHQLYNAAQENNILLAGVVEDTRSTNFCTMLQENGVTSPVLEDCRDSHLLHYLLEEGERTLVMEYTESQHHPILSDLGGHENNLYTFYMRPAANDRPIRIDLYAAEEPENVAEQLASHIYAISGAGASYGIPSVIIEADKRAKLERHEVKMYVDRIQSKLPGVSGAQELRRERRPF